MGIIEIAGLKGSGKTNYVINIFKKEKTLILCSKPFPIENIMQKFKKEEIFNSIFFKNIFLFNELLETITKIVPFHFKTIIIDTFDSLCLCENYIDIRRDIIYMIQILKRHCFECDTRIYILNECYDSNLKYNYTLKFEWRYLVNETIKLLKKKRKNFD
ncbi:hypothetical protein GVAV_000522 [Gurleya vavrai]